MAAAATTQARAAHSNLSLGAEVRRATAAHKAAEILSLKRHRLDAAARAAELQAEQHSSQSVHLAHQSQLASGEAAQLLKAGQTAQSERLAAEAERLKKRSDQLNRAAALACQVSTNISRQVCSFQENVSERRQHVYCKSMRCLPCIYTPF